MVMDFHIKLMNQNIRLKIMSSTIIETNIYLII
jgi:hypothetical protein